MKQSHSNLKLNQLNKTLSGQEAFNWCINRVYGDKQTIWLKFSHNQFLVGKRSQVNLCEDFWLTSGNRTDRQLTGKIANVYEYLLKRSQSSPGGVFYLPGKPTKYPIKEFCFASNDIGAELDWGTHDDQWEQINRFVAESGLYPDSAINSGGKSVHPHWRGTKDFPIATWIYLRRLLAIALLGDPAVCNPHQPMRLAGFWRFEKGKEQILEYWGDHQYSSCEFISGFKRAYSKLNLTFPETITDEWWRTSLRPILTSTLEAHEKYSRLRSELAAGLVGYEKHLQNEQTLQQQRLLKKQQFTQHFGTTNLVELVEQAEARLGSDAFNWSGHHWKWSGLTRARGCCPWHESKSGTAGWIAPRRGGKGGWGYACPTCTDNRSLGAFAYWWYLKQGLNATYPSGKDWVDAAREFCTLAGVVVPDLPKTQWGIDENGKHSAIICSGIEALFKAKNNLEQAKKQSFFNHLIQKILKLPGAWQKGFNAPAIKKEALQIKLPKIINYTPNMPLPTQSEYQGKKAPTIQFETRYKNHITKVMLALKQLGWAGAWDNSYTGSGKSYRVTEIAQDLIYLDVNFKNPSIENIKNQFVIMPIRHDGLILSEDGRLIRAKTESQKYNPFYKSNCINADLLNVVNLKGYSVEGSGQGGHPPNPICAMCPFWRQKVKVGDNYIPLCRASRGDGYGFLYERLQALASVVAGQNAAAYPDQLPLPVEPSADEKGNETTTTGIDYRNKILAWEEASLLARGTREILAGKVDYDSAISTLISQVPKSAFLAPLLNPLRELIMGGYASGLEVATALQNPNNPHKIGKYYGLTHAELVQVLGNPPVELQQPEFIQEIARALDFHQVIVEPDSIRAQENGGKWKNNTEKRLAASARRALQSEACAQTAFNIKQLPSNWLIHFLMIWSGQEKGIFRLEKNGELTILINDDHHQQLATAAGFNLFLDATGDKEQTCITLGLDPDTIIEISEIAPSFNNLTVYNVNLPGMKSNNWSTTCQGELHELISRTTEKYGADNVSIIGQKCHALSLGYQHWFGKDERGSNDFKGKKVLIVLGTPWDNWGAVRDRYLLLNNTPDGLQEYYQAQVKEKFIQTMGRQRVHLQPKQEFIMIFVGTGQDLSYLEDTGAKIINKEMLEFCPSAAPPRQQHKWQLFQYARKLNRTGQKITQAALAQGLGVTQGYISKLFEVQTLSWKQFLQLFQVVFKDNIELGIFSPNQVKDSVFRCWLEIAENSPIEIAVEFVNAIKSLSFEGFKEVLANEPPDVGAGILGILTHAVDGSWELMMQFVDTGGRS